MAEPSDEKPVKAKRKRRRLFTLKGIGLTLLILVAIGAIARAFAPTAITWYVNRTLNKSIQYRGHIDEIDLSLWRGAYQIKKVRLIKKAGNTPAPLFECDQIDLAVDWSALFKGRLVGVIQIDKPQINFVDGGSDASDQTGEGGPWLGMIRDLFPFEINRAEVADGSVHFRAPTADPPVDVYVDSLNASLTNLRNINDDTNPLLARIQAKGTAMGHAPVEIDVKFDPTSYYPTFELATRMVGLRVRDLNDFAKAYGGVDFESGFFDLVLVADCTEGRIDGYVKPLFRNLRVLTIPKDMTEDNVLEFFWESIVGVAAGALQNQPRQQLGTQIPFKGSLQSPKPDILVGIGNVLRNAFIRAYLPKLDRSRDADQDIEFEPGVLSDVGVALEN